MDFNYDHMSFACGEKNPIGLHLRFSVEGDIVRTTFIPQEEHEGYPGIMHGGLITTILDEVMARSVDLLGYYGVTARMELRFRESIPTGTKVTFKGKIINVRKKIVDLEAKAFLPNRNVAAEASARFMLIGKLAENKKADEK